MSLPLCCDHRFSFDTIKDSVSLPLTDLSASDDVVRFILAEMDRILLHDEVCDDEVNPLVQPRQELQSLQSKVSH